MPVETKRSSGGSDTESLRIEAIARGPILYVRLSGPIDETFNIDDIINAGPGRDVLINAAAVSRISSFGVRQWVNGMARLAQMRNRILLLDCAPVVVQQANMVANFAEHVDVVSIRAPYFCAQCGWETTIELAVTAQGVVTPEAPPACRCGASMELNEHPASFFRFARPDRFSPPEDHIREFIESYVRATPAAKGSPVQQAVRRVWGRVRHDKRVWTASAVAVAAGVVIALLIAVLVRDRTEGVAPEVLQRYHALLAEQKFDDGAALLRSLQESGEIPEDLARSMLTELDTRRSLSWDAAFANGRSLFLAKRYTEALSLLVQAERLAPAVPPELLFTVAECHRRLGQRDQADARYVAYIAATEAAPNDAVRDDAIFWHADHLLKQGKTAEAVPLLQQLSTMTSSNFRRSSQRMLKKLPR